MDHQKIVENIQRICREKGTTPTAAGEASGAGKSLVSHLKKRGVVPSIEKFQLLAQYLGVTVSELLGEEPPVPGDGDGPAPEFVRLYERLSEEEKISIVKQMKGLLAED